MSATHVICLKVPVRIESEANKRQHWCTVAKRKKDHRRLAFSWLIADKRRRAMVELPCTITLTRIAPRTLDDDNLAGGFKAFRDGVADWLEVDDGDRRLTWRYEQRKGRPHEYAAEVRIESAVDVEGALRALATMRQG